ncbi:MAG: MaoC family dehydratase N-terminal domain-containing protein [Pseudonocardia sp.]|nr:MaoC family dehydratase N-terminal domain-containing protein [Pseudonocardia sp.]
MPDASYVGTARARPPPTGGGGPRGGRPPPPRGGPASVCLDPAAAQAAGHADLVAPPTFSVTFTMPLIEAFLRDPAFGWDYSRMVHGDQSVTLHRPIHAGDELVTTIHVEELTARAGSHLLTLRCEVTDPDGAAVATTRSLLVTQGES